MGAKGARRRLDRALRVFGYRLYQGPARGRGIYIGPISGRHDTRRPLPPGAEHYLRRDNPELLDLEDRYRRMVSPLTDHAVWTGRHRQDGIHLPYFRGDNAYIWQLRHMGRKAREKYLAYAEYVHGLDHRGLLHELVEDGAFGCWTFDDGRGRTVSRDLLDSINEMYFLDRTWGLFERKDFTVADIGAGYGRLATHMTRAAPGLRHYFCLDAVPESTFLSRFYIGFRGCEEKASSVPLDELDQRLAGVSIDLGVAIHSFSEMSSAAIESWVSRLVRTGARHLLVVSNEADELFASESGGTRVDAMPILERHGYRLQAAEPVLRDVVTRRTVGTDNYFLFFELHERNV
ncbi:hypothetical protein [Streptosporangium sp. NPDC000396]|uniref:hypothetical protein n=1 Tax=Streptosporangium sp. NPDC000396 TaxID=3366185 RepID=UPI00368EC685